MRRGAVLAVALFCAGCGYRLGTMLPPDIKSIHVPTFVNRCNEPLVETETTSAAIREFQKDGTLKVVDAAKADTRLDVSVTGYTLEALRQAKDRALTTKEYRLKLTVEMVFKRRSTGEELLRKKVEGDTTFTPAGDMTSSKREALPKAAKNLAHNIVEAVVEYW